MRAFDAHAVDYLLKPFGAERFEAALERAEAGLGRRSLRRRRIAAAAPARRSARSASW